MEWNSIAVVRSLSAATGVQLSPNDYYDWLEGGEGYDKFDAAVKQYLGDDLFTAAENTARLDGVLLAILEGKREDTIGGMHFDFHDWYKERQKGGN